MEKKNLIIVDGSNYAYRAFYAIRELSNSKGFPTNAIYGFTKMLFKILRDFSPTHIAVVFDTKGQTLRHSLYSAYKATRKRTPDALVVQLPAIKEIIQALGITVIEQEGVEADDIIGSLACRWALQGGTATIVSGDKDFLQLIGDRIVLLDTMKDVRYDVAKVKEFLGVEPHFVVDLLALMGDTSDNIPGVAGIGKRGAQGLIEQFGHVEDIIANIDKITNARLKESLRQNLESLLLSYDLVRIRSDVETPEWEVLHRKGIVHDKLLELLRLYEFSSLLQEVKREKQSEEAIAPLLVGKEVTIDAFVEQLRQAAPFALVLAKNNEKEALSPSSNEKDGQSTFLGAAFSTSTGESYYTPYDLLVGASGEALRIALGDPSLGKVVHDSKALGKALAAAGIKMAGCVFDTMLAAYLLNSAQRSYDIESVSWEHLGHLLAPTSAGDDEARVAITNAQVLLVLHKSLEAKLTANGLLGLLQDVELPLAGVLGEMEERGVLVDGDSLEAMSKELELLLASQEQKIHALAGERFNINSSKQLQAILFEKMHLPKGKKTKEGYSTDNEVLSNLALKHELPAEILAYRSIAKLKSTYIDALPKMLDSHTGRIHTFFNQTGTTTGRLSSSHPNLQNIPIRTPLGRRIRQAFIPPVGWKLLCVDYSQIELRVLAHLSADVLLKEAFFRGEDIHSSTAVALFDVFPTMVSAEMRRFAKVINFGVIYGMGAFRLARELGLDQKTAQRYIDDYFRKHEGVRRYLDEVVVRVKKDGFVSTIFNRRRYFPEITSENQHIRQFVERAAINATVQGSAADIIKMAMLGVKRRLDNEGSKAYLVLQVHDELVFECPAEEVSSLSPLVVEVMENVVSLSVPLKVNISIGDNWDEAH